MEGRKHIIDYLTNTKRGLECRSCGCETFYVLYTRATVGGRILRRRELSVHCNPQTNRNT